MKNIKSVDEFKKVLSENKKVVVDFYADWCGPCKMMSPMFEAAATEVKDVVFVKLNVDELQSIAQEFEISSIPTMILFKDGKLFEQSSGFMPKDKIVSFAKQ